MAYSPWGHTDSDMSEWLREVRSETGVHDNAKESEEMGIIDSKAHCTI